MKIRILSDLHREFGHTEIPRQKADLIIPAGDIDTKQNAVNWVRDFCGSTPTAYVCGNHEFYGDKLPKVGERLAGAFNDSNIHQLEDGFFTLEDWHVYGCTLWTDMALAGDWRDGATVALEKMNDYKRIRNSSKGYKKPRPNDTRLLHLQSLQRMKDFLEEHDPSRTIIVTHHAPSALSLAEHRKHEVISCAYASNLDDFIALHQPHLWIHGHIHHNNDYFIGRTRVISNPLAYPDEPNQGFIPKLVVEV
jgi:predicted phosphodiesterase